MKITRTKVSHAILTKDHSISSRNDVIYERTRTRLCVFKTKHKIFTFTFVRLKYSYKTGQRWKRLEKYLSDKTVLYDLAFRSLGLSLLRHARPAPAHTITVSQRIKRANNAAIVLGARTKGKKEQRNSFLPTLGLSLTTYAFCIHLPFFFIILLAFLYVMPM